MAETAADGGGPAELVKSAFFLKTLVFVVFLIVLGAIAPPLFPENEFVGVFVGMVWSIAFLIVAVIVVAVVSSAVRTALR